jgi:hypothetical protein
LAPAVKNNSLSGQLEAEKDILGRLERLFFANFGGLKVPAGPLTAFFRPIWAKNYTNSVKKLLPLLRLTITMMVSVIMINGCQS